MSNVLHTARNIKPIKVALASGGTPSPERQAFNAAFALARAKYLAGQGPSTFPYKGALYGVDVANKPMLQGRVGQPANVPLPPERPDNLGQSTEDHAAPMPQPNNWGASGFGGDKDVSPAPQSPITAQPATGSMADYANAIKQIESSGRYHIMGPATKSGDRAYGAYQVMGANIPSWTKAATGQSLTPQQFLASPEAQDAVFNYHFGNAVKKYGSPEDAASVWFSGRPMAAAGNAADITGTTVPQYVQNFRNALGRVQTANSLNPDVNAPAAVHAGPQFTTDNQAPPSPANVPLPPVRPASFDQSPPLASGFPQVNANVPVQPNDTGDRMPPLASGFPQVNANVPAEDYEAPSFGEGITPSSYEVKPNATNADIDAMQKDLEARKLGMGAGSLWEANKDSYADGGEVDQEPITAYQGGPHSVGPEGYSNEKIGTGEGAQSFGYGHYFAEHEPVAQQYKNKLTPEGQIGHMHQVAIHAHPDHFLDWDKPLHHQSEHVQNLLSGALNDAWDHSPDAQDMFRDIKYGKKPSKRVKTGEDLYNALKPTFGDRTENSKTASEILLKNGIRGIKYLDAGSRAAGNGTRNYVVFDPKDIEIMRRYAKGGDVSAWHSNHPLFGKKRGGYIPHHNPIVEQALNKTSIAPLDVMSLVKRSRGRP